MDEERVKDTVSLKQKIDSLRNFLKKKLETSFSELIEGSKDRVEVVVSFLAMLEMVKKRVVVVEQEEMFHDIRMKVNKK